MRIYIPVRLHMKLVFHELFITGLLFFVNGICFSQTNIYPVNFKVQMPFQTDSKGIIIETYWGLSHAKQRLHWDNHSPTWANNSVIVNNNSITKPKKNSYRTTTADGTFIQGDVFVCDSIFLPGNIFFTDVTSYRIPKGTLLVGINGAFGENLISKGIWEINFVTNVITFASSVDSLEDIFKAEIFPARFSAKGLEIDIELSNHSKKKAALDFGYNREILLPWKVFHAMKLPAERVKTDSILFSTPASAEVVQNSTVADTISIGGNPYGTLISSNKEDKRILIGRMFFMRFEFVIFDYMNKRIWVSKKRLF
jgi:hypothetical protein